MIDDVGKTWRLGHPVRAVGLRISRTQSARRGRKFHVGAEKQKLRGLGGSRMGRKRPESL